MKLLERLIIPLIIFTGLSVAFLLLINASYFIDYKTSTLNEILTPIATIIAFAIYYATLLEIKKTNTKLIKFQNIAHIKERIENLKIQLEAEKISISKEFQEKFKLEKQYNLINFFAAYKEIHNDMRTLINQKKDIYEHAMFFFNICFVFSLRERSIINIVDEIKNEKFDKLQSNIVKENLIRVLNDYLHIVSYGKLMKITKFIYEDERGKKLEVFGYDVPFSKIPTNELITLFDKMEFSKVYEYLKKEKII